MANQQNEWNCFNSMKVRLKPADLSNMYIQSLFQFHEGPIKTSLRCLRSRYCSCFNSMKVRLKRCKTPAWWTRTLCFNSMKVRLKPKAFAAVTATYLSFNSMKVRLKLFSS